MELNETADEVLYSDLRVREIEIGCGVKANAQFIMTFSRLPPLAALLANFSNPTMYIAGSKDLQHATYTFEIIKMFKKEFTPGSKTKVKSSAQRGIRTQITETYPLLTPYIDVVLPKKEQLELMKLPDRVSLYALGSTPLFWQHMDDPLIPHLTLVHKYPQCFPRIRIDRGAIRFVLSGASLMVPGLTSTGGRLPGEEGWSQKEDLDEGDVVVVEAEGKDNACLVGMLKMGTKEMREKKKGVGIENGHYLGDGLWKLSLD